MSHLIQKLTVVSSRILLLSYQLWATLTASYLKFNKGPIMAWWFCVAWASRAKSKMWNTSGRDRDRKREQCLHSAVHHLSHCLSIPFDPCWQLQCVIHGLCITVLVFQSAKWNLRTRNEDNWNWSQKEQILGISAWKINLTVHSIQLLKYIQINVLCKSKQLKMICHLNTGNHARSFGNHGYTFGKYYILLHGQQFLIKNTATTY